MRTKHEHYCPLIDGLRREQRDGAVVVSRGVQALEDDFVQDISEAVASFAFDSASDPCGDHDSGSLVVAGYWVLFKIAYYNCNLRCHSPDPADPDVTRRVLTIMLAEEQ